MLFNWIKCDIPIEVKGANVFFMQGWLPEGDENTTCTSSQRIL